ncbi:hypothetical protein [Actinomadura sp. SCN-SB]|uniref:hypothetical protein n=1 Tax=Actinomadura sp. SCN-SB TaxID=3373092 RepID=UPI0037531C07
MNTDRVIGLGGHGTAVAEAVHVPGRPARARHDDLRDLAAELGMAPGVWSARWRRAAPPAPPGPC